MWPQEHQTHKLYLHKQICEDGFRDLYAPAEERFNAKPMPASIKTLGDLIQIKRIEKKLTPGHLAAKMGIAAILVRSWENGTVQPDNGQLEVLANLLGFGALDNDTTTNLRGFGQ